MDNVVIIPRFLIYPASCIWFSERQFRYAEYRKQHGDDDKPDNQPHYEDHGGFKEIHKALNRHTQAFLIGARNLQEHGIKLAGFLSYLDHRECEGGKYVRIR